GPADEADRGESGAPAVDGSFLCLADARMVGKAEIVVGGQHHDLAAADLHPRVLRRLQDELFLVRTRLAQLRHLAGEVVDETHGVKLSAVSSQLSAGNRRRACLADS